MEAPQKQSLLAFGVSRAGVHLCGAYGVADLLLKNQPSDDEYGTSILKYMEEYGGYNVSPADFF